MPTDPIPTFQGARQVIDGPVLAAGCVRVWTQHISWTLQAHFVSHFLNLTDAQFRPHRPASMFAQSLKAKLAIFATPFHQTRPIAACDLADVTHRILLPVQPHRLIARPRLAISTIPIRSLQILVLFLCQFKPSSCHPFIVRLCSEFSISSLALSDMGPARSLPYCTL